MINTIKIIKIKKRALTLHCTALMWKITAELVVYESCIMGYHIHKEFGHPTSGKSYFVKQSLEIFTMSMLKLFDVEELAMPPLKINFCFLKFAIEQ